MGWEIGVVSVSGSTGGRTNLAIFNKWLAELQQDMLVEINPADAQARGIRDGAWVWVTGAENGALRPT